MRSLISRISFLNGVGLAVLGRSLGVNGEVWPRNSRANSLRIKGPCCRAINYTLAGPKAFPASLHHNLCIIFYHSSGSI